MVDFPMIGESRELINTVVELGRTRLFPNGRQL